MKARNPLTALGDDTRRALYELVARQPSTREEAAAAIGVPLHTAKFHLDRLVKDGLLTATYRRPPGRSGPGAGRPTKVYASAGELEISVPARRYDVAGRILVRAAAVSQATDKPLADALKSVARKAGRDVADEADAADLPGRLAECGYEPDATAQPMVLRNCPFHRLVEENADLVCTMNLWFVRGILDRSGGPAAKAKLDPADGRCCVTIRQD